MGQMGTVVTEEAVKEQPVQEEAKNLLAKANKLIAELIAIAEDLKITINAVTATEE
jgi:hypothetical protein